MNQNEILGIRVTKSYLGQLGKIAARFNITVSDFVRAFLPNETKAKDILEIKRLQDEIFERLGREEKISGYETEIDYGIPPKRVDIKAGQTVRIKHEDLRLLSICRRAICYAPDKNGRINYEEQLCHLYVAYLQALNGIEGYSFNQLDITKKSGKTATIWAILGGEFTKERVTKAVEDYLSQIEEGRAAAKESPGQ